MLVLIGKQGSGKTTLINEFEKDQKYKRVVGCTTRPRRGNEVEGQDYYFYTKEEFIRNTTENNFLEYQEHRGWFYGTLKESIVKEDEKENVLILTYKGYKKLKEEYPNVKAIYIKVDFYSRFKKVLETRSDKLEAIRREIKDMIDFSFITKDKDIYTIKNKHYMYSTNILKKKIEQFF